MKRIHADCCGFVNWQNAVEINKDPQFFSSYVYDVYFAFQIDLTQIFVDSDLTWIAERLWDILLSLSWNTSSTLRLCKATWCVFT